MTRYQDRDNLVLWWRDLVTERIRTRSAATSDPRAAERAAADLERELAEADGRHDSRITWADFRLRYQAEHLPTLAPRTAEPWRAAANHLERTIAPHRLRSITTSLVSRFAAALMAEGMEPTTVGVHLGHLRTALNWAYRMGLLADKVDVRLPRSTRSQQMRSRPITADEYQRLIDATPAVRPVDASEWIRLQQGLWLSGLRLSEAVALHWTDPPISVDFSGRHPRLRVLAEGHKRRKDQLLPITPDFAQWLTTQTDKTGYVFRLRSQGLGKKGRLTAKTVGRVLSEIGKSAGISVGKDKWASAHDFRRAFATRWAPKVAPAVLQLLMRHDSITTTMAYYVGLDADELVDSLWTSEPADATEPLVVSAAGAASVAAG